jgi:hypothetical protein
MVNAFQNLAHRRPQLTGTAVVPFTSSRQAEELLIQAAVARRNKLSETFIVPLRLGYVELTPAPEINTISEGIGETNLASDFRPETQKLIRELEKQAEKYFKYRGELFKFNNRDHRNLFDLLKRPQTYADLEEENIEEKFPEDIEYRAFMCALNKAIKRNQYIHIIKKRLRQFYYTLPVAVLFVFWSYLVNNLNNVLADMRLPILSMAIPRASFSPWILMLASLLYIFIARYMIKNELEQHVHLFLAANTGSCRTLNAIMTNINSKIRSLYNRLLKDIRLSQAAFENITNNEWPSRVEKVFKLAIWQGKRIEYLERFWQIQFEKLRVFQLVSSLGGNMLSYFVSALIVTIAFIITLLVPGNGRVIGIDLAIFIFAAWYFGYLTRKSEYSFSIDTIVKQGLEKNWISFNSQYYNGIGQQMRSDKDEIRTAKLGEGLARR